VRVVAEPSRCLRADAQRVVRGARPLRMLVLSEDEEVERCCFGVAASSGVPSSCDGNELQRVATSIAACKVLNTAWSRIIPTCHNMVRRHGLIGNMVAPSNAWIIGRATARATPHRCILIKKNEAKASVFSNKCESQLELNIS
jgi:hypothetical protein